MEGSELEKEEKSRNSKDRKIKKREEEVN